MNPDIGVRIIDAIDALSEAALVIKHHHERYDGNGYPDGLEGEEIPLAARIVAAVDAYDVMTRGRSYPRHRRTQAEVLEVMSRESGLQFDPRVVEVLIGIVKSE